MEKFEVNILGCGSAVPTARHMTTAQLVNVHEKVFLVDCGEGTQTQIWKSGIKVTNMNHIFISHAHGDHFFGLVPLISSLGLMLDRKTDLHLWLPADLQAPLEKDLEQYCYLPFKLIMHPLDTTKQAVIYEDKDMKVETIPLNHRVPCCGFLFSEKEKPAVLLPERCKAYNIPPKEFGKIKAGANWTLEDGTVVPNSELTMPSDFVPRKYAYCSDTAYYPEMIPQIMGVSLLYHEATFTTEDQQSAENAAHSTAAQAATIARDANVGKLAIGHYSIRYDDEAQLLTEAQAIFANTVATQEGMVIEVL
ncbi:MAG: ribonuclease Z [Muribaculaceae bacterium]